MPEKDLTFFRLKGRRSSTSLQVMESREVLPCPHCHLVQFRTRNLLCRRCHKPLGVRVKLPLRADLVVSTQENTNETVSEIGRHLGLRVREIRKMRGLSQNALSHRMKAPRTYISKVEMNRTVPTIATPYRIANALEIQVYEMLCNDAWTSQLVCSVTSDDPFLQEIALLSKIPEFPTTGYHPAGRACCRTGPQHSCIDCSARFPNSTQKSPALPAELRLS